MDRILILSDDQAFTSHIEKTLNQVGFEVAVQSHAKDLKSLVEVFNPQLIIAKGESEEISTLKVGQALRYPLDFKGKVILIFPRQGAITPDEINRVRMDYVLFEPVGALKVIAQVINLMSQHKEIIKQRLLKIAEMDDSFKRQEEKLIISGGKSYEQEVIRFSGEKDLDEDRQIARSKDDLTEQDKTAIKGHFMKELADVESKYNAKIDLYNEKIKNIDIDLKKGLKKRQTNDEQKRLRKELLVDPGKEKLDSLDLDKIKFVGALFKKKDKK